jgi:hypothetical protein
MIALSSTARPRLDGQSLSGTLPSNPAIVLRKTVTVHLISAAQASGQHPAAMTLAYADPTHREIVAGLAIALLRHAFATTRPPWLEPVRHAAD